MTTQQGSSAARNTPTPGRMEDTGRELGRRADEVAERVTNSVREKAHEIDATRRHLQERIGDAKTELASRADAGRERAAQEVHDHPIRTLLLATGAGVLVGLLLGRRARK